MGPENGYVETVDEIKIPVLKSLVYTTGRGGTVSFFFELNMFGYVIGWSGLT